MTIKPWMSEEQRAYIEANAACEAAQAQVQAASPPAPERGDHAGLELYAEAREALNEKYNLLDIISNKIDARHALFDWCKAILARDKASEPELSEVLAIFDRVYRNDELLEELTAICLTLNPSVPDTEMGER